MIEPWCDSPERQALLAEIARLNAIWNVQSFLLHEMASLLTDADRSAVYEAARRLAAEQEPLRQSRPLQVIPYLGNLARDCWPPTSEADAERPWFDALQYDLYEMAEHPTAYGQEEHAETHADALKTLRAWAEVLEIIRTLPSESDLLTNAVARAMYEIAERAKEEPT